MPSLSFNASLPPWCGCLPGRRDGRGEQDGGAGYRQAWSGASPERATRGRRSRAVVPAETHEHRYRIACYVATGAKAGQGLWPIFLADAHARNGDAAAAADAVEMAIGSGDGLPGWRASRRPRPGGAGRTCCPRHDKAASKAALRVRSSPIWSGSPGRARTADLVINTA